MPEQTDTRLNATFTAPDLPNGRLTVRVSTTVTEQDCPACGDNNVRTAELIDEHGAPVATTSRCDQCTGRRRRDQS